MSGLSELAEQYAALVAEARDARDAADAIRYRSYLLHDAVLQAMIDAMLSSVRTSRGLLMIDRNNVHAAYRDGDARRAIDAVIEHAPELASVNHKLADQTMRRILAQKGGEYFDEPSDAFSRAFEPKWDTKLILRRS